MHHLSKESWLRLEGVVPPFFGGEPLGRKCRCLLWHLPFICQRVGQALVTVASLFLSHESQPKAQKNKNKWSRKCVKSPQIQFHGQEVDVRVHSAQSLVEMFSVEAKQKRLMEESVSEANLKKENTEGNAKHAVSHSWIKPFWGASLRHKVNLRFCRRAPAVR